MRLFSGGERKLRNDLHLNRDGIRMRCRRWPVSFGRIGNREHVDAENITYACVCVCVCERTRSLRFSGTVVRVIAGKGETIDQRAAGT